MPVLIGTRPRSTLPLVMIVAIGLATLAGCRAEAPERPPQPNAEPVSPRPADTHGIGTELPVAGPGTPAGDTLRRTEIDRTARTFLTTIESGDERSFREMLSSRSRDLINDVKATDDVFRAAQEALGTIRGRSLTYIGGDADSVALRLRGMRVSASDTTEEELILIMLNEQGRWRLMYPGLLHPRAHLMR